MTKNTDKESHKVESENHNLSVDLNDTFLRADILSSLSGDIMNMLSVYMTLSLIGSEGNIVLISYTTK